MPARSLSGNKIRLSCTLKNKHGTLLGEPESIRTVGREVSVKVAKQLLAGHSAALIDQQATQPAPDIRRWPEPVLFGHFEPKGKFSRNVSVHIPIYLDGKKPSWLKVFATGHAFRKLSEYWLQVSERRLGMVAIKVILAGSGNASALRNAAWPSGIEVQDLKVGRIASVRPVPVEITLKQDSETHTLKFLAEKEAYRDLSGFHYGDELSDSRFGYLLRQAVWTGCAYAARESPGKGKGRRKWLQRSAWKMAGWLGLALLPPMRNAYQGNDDNAKRIVSAMKAEVADLKINPRSMAAFLVHKNWQNVSQRRWGKQEKWPSRITPLLGTNLRCESGSFWDEIFYRQKKLKKFPWARIRKNNPERFNELTRDWIIERKAARKDFDWDRFQKEQPRKFNQAIEAFLDERFELYPFRQSCRVPREIASAWPKYMQKELKWDRASKTYTFDIPIQGPYFMLPKPFDEIVSDILANRDAFILSPD